MISSIQQYILCIQITVSFEPKYSTIAYIYFEWRFPPLRALWVIVIEPRTSRYHVLLPGSFGERHEPSNAMPSKGSLLRRAKGHFAAAPRARLAQKRRPCDVGSHGNCETFAHVSPSCLVIVILSTIYPLVITHSNGKWNIYQWCSF